ncbi:uncharacterized protein LOC5502923 isoform X2 [Nematostella vectensis]|uniref:uncharacterized protein LOC5502923 isoform X2 n=1 Tax=Nematostella vectensis TaxID=45351 RepID=UPI002077254E|nr:uncharacterized protein LOC5502923 isoform X2 [Nematostella vectensis]
MSDTRHSRRANMAVGVFLLVGTVITNAYAVGSGIGEPAYCTTRPQALPVDPIHNRYLPYFALIYQCGGGCLGSPKILTCRNISSEEVFVDVLDEITLSMVRLKMYNHTKCNCGCTTSPMDCSQHQRFDENQCRCTCDLPDAPCEKYFIWDKDLCKCRCNRAPIPCGDDSKIRLWDEESCGCTCSQRVVKRCARKNKDLDLSTCQCVDVQALQRVNQSNESRDRMYITFLVLCGFCIIVLVCIMVHYIRKSRKHQHSTAEPFPTPLTKQVLSRSDSGNVSSCSHTSGDVRKLPEKTRLDSNSNGSIGRRIDPSRDAVRPPSYGVCVTLIGNPNSKST